MEYLKALDLSLFRFLNSSFINAPADMIAPLAENGLYYALIGGGVLLLLLPSARLRLAGLVLLAGDTVAELLVTWLKEFFARPRPCASLTDAHVLLTKSSFSFPSGHSVHAFAAAVYLFFIFGRRAGVALVTAAALIGLSKIYCGVHYPSDVAAGALLGSALGLLMRAAGKRIPLRADEKDGK